MKNLFFAWCKCLGLVILIPVGLLLLPGCALLDCLRGPHSFRLHLQQYWQEFTHLEVRITPRW